MDEKFSKIEGQIFYFEKYYNEFKVQYNKQPVEEVFIERAIIVTIQILYDKGLFDNYTNGEKVLEDFLFTTRHRIDLSEQVKDVIQ